MADEQEVQQVETAPVETPLADVPADVPLPGPPTGGASLEVFCFACGKKMREEPSPARHEESGGPFRKTDRCKKCSAAAGASPETIQAIQED